MLCNYILVNYKLCYHHKVVVSECHIVGRKIGNPVTAGWDAGWVKAKDVSNKNSAHLTGQVRMPAPRSPAVFAGNLSAGVTVRRLQQR